MDSLEDFIKGMRFKSNDVKQLANVVQFSHANLSNQISNISGRVNGCDKRIDSLQKGDFAEMIVKKTRWDFIRALIVALTIIGTAVGVAQALLKI